jgi:hypothetical protein
MVVKEKVAMPFWVAVKSGKACDEAERIVVRTEGADASLCNDRSREAVASATV